MTAFDTAMRTTFVTLPFVLFGGLSASLAPAQEVSTSGHSLADLSNLEESMGAIEVLAPGTNPLPEGVEYRTWFRTPTERPENDETVDENRLARDWRGDSWIPDLRKAAQGRALLERMADFLGQQPSVQFSLKYDLNRQTTMGVIETSAEPEPYEFAFAKPNLFRAMDSRPRDDKWHWEILSDGESMLRTLGGTLHVEDAPADLPGLTQSSSFDVAWAYYLDTRAIMSLFDRNALNSWLGERAVEYVGTESFGSVAADHVVVEVPRVPGVVGIYKRLHLFICQGPHPVPLLMVRDSDSDSGWDDAWDDQSDPRGKDVELYFREWCFNEAEAEGLFAITLPNQQLVDSPNQLAYGVKTSLPPFVGEPVPAFTATTANGATVQSSDLADGRPTVLFSFESETMFADRWKAASAAERMLETEYGADRVRTLAVYIGDETEPEKQAQLFARLQDRSCLERTGIVIPPRILGNNSNRFAMQTSKYICGCCAVLDGTGQVVAFQSVIGRPDFEKLALENVRALLRGEDVVANRRREISEQNASRAARRRALEEKLAARAAHLQTQR
ncbi:MAG: hypothetical protein AAF196_00850 [Planctomycetota bacterium]